MLVFMKINPVCVHLFLQGLAVSGNLAPTPPDLVCSAGATVKGAQMQSKLCIFLSISKLLI